MAERLGCGHDHCPELRERFAAYVDGAATSDQQQSKRFASLAGPWEREFLGRERGARGPGGVERVVLATQAALRPRCAADLEHDLAAAGEEAGKPSAVAAAALDRPRPPTRSVTYSDAKQLSIAACVRGGGRSGDHDPGRRRHNRKRVLVAVCVDTEHVVQLVCKHPTRSSDLARRVRWCRSDARETAAAGR